MLLFAQDAAPKADQPQPNPMGSLLFPMIVFGIFIFTMMWMPARKQRKEMAAMLAAIKPGSKVQTSAGIIGSIVSMKEGEDEMVIKSADAKLKVTKASIVRVLGVEDETK